MTELPETKFPEIVFEHEKSLLLGLIKLFIVVENRKHGSESLKYKHMIRLKFFGLNYGVVIRSNSKGLYCLNDQTLNT